MDFTTKEELYQMLLPVFNAKKRILLYDKYTSINNDDIWKYLIKNKWITAHNLSLSEIVNDIIIVNPDDIINYKGEQNEKKTN